VFGFRCAAIDEVGEVVALDLFQIADADADQSEVGRTYLMREQVAACGKNACGQLGRTSKCACACTDFEIRTF
jgi:hypothetical protein